MDAVGTVVRIPAFRARPLVASSRKYQLCSALSGKRKMQNWREVYIYTFRMPIMAYSDSYGSYKTFLSNMNLLGFYTCCFAGLSCALTIPVNNAINLVTPTESGLNNISSSLSNDNAANVTNPLALTNSTQSGTLEAISPNFNVLNPVVLQVPIPPLSVYMNAIAALVLMAQLNYNGQQIQGTFSEPGYLSVSIAFVPHGSPSIDRYYVIWGIYYAALIMSRTGIFKESEFGLEFNKNLVGTLAIGPARGNNGANDGGFTALGYLTETALLSEYDGSVPETTLRIATPPTNFTSGTWSTIRDSDFTNLQPNTPAYQTYTSPSTNLSTPTTNAPVVSIAYQLYGETISPNRVYLTIMECLAESGLAAFGAGGLIPPGVVFDSPLYNTYMYFKIFNDPLPPARGPQWTFGYLFDGLKAMTQVMVNERRFMEMNATVLVDVGRGGVPVGNVFLKSGARPRVGVERMVATA